MFSWSQHKLEASGQLHAPAALPSWKETKLPIREEAGWAPRDDLEDVEKGKFFTLSGLELRSVSHQARNSRYTDYTTTARNYFYIHYHYNNDIKQYKFLSSKTISVQH
jgi:hypothetical protein